MNPKDRRKVEFPPQRLAKNRQFFLHRYLCHICDVADIFVKIAKNVAMLAMFTMLKILTIWSPN